MTPIIIPYPLLDIMYNIVKGIIIIIFQNKWTVILDCICTKILYRKQLGTWADWRQEIGNRQIHFYTHFMCTVY